uniref:Aminotransferase class I/classII domain-containing protein n=1 Tax=Panagrolaimus superbus TaxID=310955 RepID=A0A914Y6Z2_9BILA
MLNAGAPGPHILKRVATMMKDATAISMEHQTLTMNGALLQYGTPDGPPEFLDALSAFLSVEYREPVNRDNLVLSAGATSGFIYLLSQIFPHKTIIWAEQLSYFLAISMLKSLAFQIRDIKIENDGIDLKDLEDKWSSTYSEEECKEAKEIGQFLGVLYLVPHYHNPTGTELSPKKCQKIIEIARKYSILVFCDDVYNILHYNDRVNRRLFAYDNPKDLDYGSGHVISNGTFSKLLSPGLRIGWIEMPMALKKKFWSERSGGSANPYTAGIITELLKDGQVSKLVKEIRVENKAKMEALLMILSDELPKECQIFHKPTGGYFVYIKLPDNLISTNVISTLRNNHELLALDGQSFWSGDPNDIFRKSIANGIRLAVAYPLLDEIIEASHIFCSTLKDLLHPK